MERLENFLNGIEDNSLNGTFSGQNREERCFLVRPALPWAEIPWAEISPNAVTESRSIEVFEEKLEWHNWGGHTWEWHNWRHPLSKTRLKPHLHSRILDQFGFDQSNFASIKLNVLLCVHLRVHKHDNEKQE